MAIYCLQTFEAPRGGLEPPTFRLTVERNYQLCYLELLAVFNVRFQIT